ncbi:MAG: nuclear transport factor 2 family protein [Halioglobus sp.]
MTASREIENLIYIYAERIDSGDLEGVAELFRYGEIVSTTYNTCHAGYDEVLSLYEQACRIYPDSGTPKTRHLTSNVIIEINDSGTAARTRSCFTVLQATETLPLQPIISGRYHDSFTLGTTGWQFARREMFIDLMGDCSAHLLYTLGAAQGD